MIGGNKALRADKLKDPREASRDDMWAAGISLVLCAFSIGAIVMIMWLGT